MPLTINTNMAASQAAYYLSRNNDNLQASLNRLSSGKRITQPSDDAGGLAVSMKLNGSIDRIKEASNNVSNAISFLQVQDGLLESAANIVSRMGELKGLYADVLKSSSDKATYDSEFADLQGQLYQLSLTKFNGVSIFANATGTAGAPPGNPPLGKTFGTDDGAIIADEQNSMGARVYITEDGSSGSSVTINKTLLLSALTFTTTVNTDGVTTAAASAIWNDTNAATIAAGVPTTAQVISLAIDTSDDGAALDLGMVDTFTFNQALENIATARASNGGQVSRLNYAQQNLQSQATNMQAAVGRIMDVDVAEETANLAKQQILVQASASMVAQANTSNNVALMLLQ